MSEIALLPWHAANWAQVISAHGAGRLAHGLLLRGPVGLGKRRFAEALGAWMLCEQPGDAACGHCRGCRLRAGGNHPDFFRLVPDEDKTQIRVEQVRALIAAISLSSQMQGYKVIVIDPAETMNVNAQNSLLKTLEEPPSATLLLLVTSRPALLTPTILSRCQMVRFRAPDRDSAIDWLRARRDGGAEWKTLLNLAGGAPLRAMELADAGGSDLDEQLAHDLVDVMNGRTDPLSVAEAWAGEQLLLRLRWLQRLVYALVQWKLSGQAPELVHNLLIRSLQKPIAATSVKDIFRYLDAVERVVGLADRTVNLTLTMLPLMTVWAAGPRFQQTLTEAP